MKAQWAAVTTHKELIKLPPHLKFPFESIRTCQPQSPGTACVPPTILFEGFKGLWPQLGGFRFSESVRFKDWLIVGVDWKKLVVAGKGLVLDLYGDGPKLN